MTIRLATPAKVLGAFMVAVAAHPAAAIPANNPTVYSNNFEGNSTAGFSAGSILLVPNGSTHILGPFAQGASTTLTITGLAAHTTVTLNFTLDVVGSMDGDGQNGGGRDQFLVTTPGAGVSGLPAQLTVALGPAITLIDHDFANYGGGNTQDYPTASKSPTTGAAGTDTLGYSGFPDSGNGIQDSIYNLSATFSSSTSSVSITFAGNTSEGTGNEFYGLDNLTVTTDATFPVTPVPEPVSLLLLAAGAAAAGVTRRRR